jgi:phosphate transport system substrate-binding protein
MLVLVSVGSAGAFYVWQSGWQTDVEDKMGGAGEIQEMLSVGGSSTVFEFSKVAAPLFESANKGFKISVSSGGSGAGVAGVGTGVLDIGSASRDVKTSELAEYPDLNRDGKKDYGVDLVTYTVAWDAVVVIVPDGNPHGLVDINESVLYDIYATNGGLTGHISILDTDIIADGVQWDEVPDGTGPGNFCIGAQDVNCYDRLDHGGTEEVFVKKLLGKGDNQLEELGINVNHAQGNQQLLPAVAGDPDGLGFMSVGYANENSDQIDIVSYDGSGSDITEEDILEGIYAGSRPINYITVGEATGDALRYIEFCMTPENNQFIASECGYISVFP